MRKILDLDDFERVVRGKLPRAVFDYVKHGSETETSLRTNRAVFDDWRLVSRVLVGVAERSQTVTLFGRRYEAPFGIAPMGGSALVAYEAHNVLARAAAEARIPFILSANSIIPLEEVARQNADTWFAAYQAATAPAVIGIADRCARAGIRVLVVTADVAVHSNRENDPRNGFGFPVRPTPQLTWDVLTHPRWMLGVLARTLAKRGIPHMVNLEPGGGPSLFSPQMKGSTAHPGLCWQHILIMREHWRGPLVIKGILSPEDVALARDHGADGVILSNHGGRQLDRAVSPITMLPAAMKAAGGMTVMIDSGYRRGTDIVKALALGAHAVFVGRPFLFAAAHGGQAAVAHGISLLREEIDKDMALLGVRRIEEITPAMLIRAGGVP
ncbi:MAG TPA: alpha-hydroxy acid oxidase [Steroidobacteraceae bacterium]